MSNELTKEQIENANKAWCKVIASRAFLPEDFFNAIAPHLQYQAQTSAPTPHRSEHWRNPESRQVECECCCAWALDAEQDKKTIASLQGQLDGWRRLCKEYSCNQTPEALGVCFARQKERLEEQIKTLQERLSDQTQRANQFGKEARELRAAIKQFIGNITKHEYSPCACEDCFGSKDALCSECHRKEEKHQ